MYTTSASAIGRQTIAAITSPFVFAGNAMADMANSVGDHFNTRAAAQPQQQRRAPRSRQPTTSARRGVGGAGGGGGGGGDLFEFVSAVGGASTVAYDLQSEGRLGLMVAANSGRPGGSVGVPGGIDASQVHCGHRTQEESLVANFLHSTAPNDARMQEATFNSAIGGKWGLPDMSAVVGPGGGGGIGSGRGIGVRGGGRRTADRYMTLQRHDYVNTTDPRAFAHPAYVVEKAWMSPLSPDGLRFRDDKRFEADLVFVAGPNASDKGGPNGSMQRTANRLAQSRTRDGHAFFREGQRHALRAGLDAMIKRGVDVALVARLSCGIYAGPWRDTADADFETVLGEVLREDLRGKRRRDHFRRVVVPMLKSPPRSSSFQHSSPSGSRSAPSCECTQCQRPRCSRPDGRGYFSHCGDSCRHGRCMHGKGGKGGKVRGYGR